MDAPVTLAHRITSCVVLGVSVVQMRFAGGVVVGIIETVYALRSWLPPTIVQFVLTPAPPVMLVFTIVQVPVRISVNAEPVEPSLNVPFTCSLPATVVS